MDFAADERQNLDMINPLEIPLADLASRAAVGERIRNIRLAKKMSQAEFGAKIGATQPQVRNWELGKTYPQPPEVAKLVELFGVDFNFIFMGDPGKVEFQLIDAISRLKK